MSKTDLEAEVVSVLPDKIKILVKNIDQFADDEKLAIGAYLKISDHKENGVMAELG